MMGYSKSHPDYIRVQIMVEAMENLLTYAQMQRIRKAAEWGGFDAGMKSLSRVSDQIAKERSEARIHQSRLEGEIISLTAEKISQTERADQWEKAFDEFPARLAEARKAG
jgi:hypothetical protein